MRERSHKLTDVEKRQFDNLYQYVKKEILMYDSTQSIPQSLVLRLKGLAVGKFLENKNIENRAEYSYETILFAFQICKPEIMSAISNKDFKTETHRFNYICKIVENNLNDVYMRVNKVKQLEEQIENMDMGNLTHDRAEYIPKTKDRKSSKLDNLW